MQRNRYKFTGKERDGESALDHFGARYYNSMVGRWMIPDWSDKPEPVPYSDLNDPQALSLYTYVRNSPTVKVDATGHDGLTIFGIPIVYNCSPHCAAEWAHEKQHSKDFWNTKMTLKEYEKRAFAAEAKVYEKRQAELEQKQASGKALTPSEQKELNEIKTERLPSARNGATDRGATDYVKRTNPGVDPNSTLFNKQPAKAPVQEQQQQNQQQPQQQTPSGTNNTPLPTADSGRDSIGINQMANYEKSAAVGDPRN